MALNLTDFSTTGLEMDCLALLSVSGGSGNPRVLYRSAVRGGTDTVIAGELGLSASNNVITQIRWDTNVNEIIINDNGALVLGTYFGTGGDGSDLTFYFQTEDDGLSSFTVAGNTASAGGNFLRLRPPSALQAILDQLTQNERFIVGFGKSDGSTPTGPTAPSVDDVTATVGTAIRVTLPTGSGGTGRLTYSVSSLPTGWSFDTSTRVLTGSNRIVAGTTTITYTITDANSQTATTTFDIVVSATPPAPLTRPPRLFVFSQLSSQSTLRSFTLDDLSDVTNHGSFGFVITDGSGMTDHNGDLLVADNGVEIGTINVANIRATTRSPRLNLGTLDRNFVVSGSPFAPSFTASALVSHGGSLYLFVTYDQFTRGQGFETTKYFRTRLYRIATPITSSSATHLVDFPIVEGVTSSGVSNAITSITGAASLNNVLYVMYGDGNFHSVSLTGTPSLTLIGQMPVQFASGNINGSGMTTHDGKIIATNSGGRLFEVNITTPASSRNLGQISGFPLPGSIASHALPAQTINANPSDVNWSFSTIDPLVSAKSHSANPGAVSWSIQTSSVIGKKFSRSGINWSFTNPDPRYRIIPRLVTSWEFTTSQIQARVTSPETVEAPSVVINWTFETPSVAGEVSVPNRFTRDPADSNWEFLTSNFSARVIPDSDLTPVNWDFRTSRVTGVIDSPDTYVRNPADSRWSIRTSRVRARVFERLEINWDFEVPDVEAEVIEPQDYQSGRLDVNWSLTNATVRGSIAEAAAGDWAVWPHTGLANYSLIRGLEAGTSYDIRVRSIREGSAPSTFVQIDDVTTDPEGIPGTVFQECYYRSIDQPVGDLPSLPSEGAGHTPEDRARFHYVPRDCSTNLLIPTREEPVVWRLTRHWSRDPELLTVWGYAGTVLRFDDAVQRLAQTTYFQSANVQVSDLPSLEGQTAERRTDILFRPAGCNDDPQAFTLTKERPLLWELKRVWSDKTEFALPWSYSRIVDRFETTQQIFQEAYHLSSGGSVGDQPNVGGQTDAQKTNKGYLPPGIFRNIPTPTEANPDVWKITRTWSNDPNIATDWAYAGIVLRFDSSQQQTFQEAYYLSGNVQVSDLPDISGQSDAQKTNKGYLPPGISRTIPTPTAANPLVWKVTRIWSTLASQASDWGYAGIVLRFDPGAQQSFQECYYVSGNVQVSDLPDVSGQTDAQKTNKGYRPPNTFLTIPVPTAENPLVWKLTRFWATIPEQASDWAYSGTVARFDDGAQQSFQECYYLAAEGSVGDLPDLGTQTNAQKTNIGYRPPGTSLTVPTPTAARPNVWKLTRHWSTVVSQASDWGYAGIILEFDDSVKQLFQECYYAAEMGSVGDLPNPGGQTDEQKTNISFIPSFCSTGIPEPTASRPNIWKLTRHYSPLASQASDWGYAGIVARLDSSSKQLYQEAYFQSASDSQSVQPNVGGQNAAQKTNINYRPSSASRSIPEPTEANKYVWKMSRTWSDNADEATDWSYDGIVRTFADTDLSQERYIDEDEDLMTEMNVAGMVGEVPMGDREIAVTGTSGAASGSTGASAVNQGATGSGTASGTTGGASGSTGSSSVNQGATGSGTASGTTGGATGNTGLSAVNQGRTGSGTATGTTGSWSGRTGSIGAVNTSQPRATQGGGHVHTVPGHSHPIPSHNHSFSDAHTHSMVSDHSHPSGSHTHTFSDSHTHSLSSSHSHSVGSHSHLFSDAHTHTLSSNHSHLIGSHAHMPGTYQVNINHQHPSNRHRHEYVDSFTRVYNNNSLITERP